jgi:hypothetical protein
MNISIDSWQRQIVADEDGPITVEDNGRSELKL